MDESAGSVGVEAVGEGAKGRTGRLVWLVWFLLSLGVGLRAVQYFGFVDMWHDELAIARNVEENSLGELATEPLDYKQVAPVGFLVALKAGASVFGTSNAGFRAVPFLFSLAGLFLFWRVLRRFALGWGLVAALGLFAVSPALFWYGNAVKPYGMDVTISLLLVWLALRHLERPEDLRRGVLGGLAGLVAIPTSFPAAPTGALLGVVLVFAWWRRQAPKHVAPLAALGGGWTLGALYSTWSALSLLEPGTDDFMQSFWVEGFPPDGLLAAMAWTGRKLFLNFAHSLYFLPPINAVFVFVAALPLALAILGILFVVLDGARAEQGRSYDKLAVLLLPAPLVAALGVAFAGVMPYGSRLAVYSNWPILVFTAVAIQGLVWRARGWPRWLRWSPAALALLVFVPLSALIVLMAAPPYDSGEPRPRRVLEELAERRQPGDAIYVYALGRHDMAFYGSRAGITADQWIEGATHYDDRRGYLHELDALRGEPRVWIFWVHLQGSRPEFPMLLEYLGTIGREIERIPPDRTSEPLGASAEGGAVLFDLSDPGRLEAASAETFEIPEHLRRDS